jgi:putative oxidoreductase
MSAQISVTAAPPVDLALLVLRLGTGVIIAAHGYQKLFMFGIGGTTQFFAGVGAPLPEITAPLVAILEFAGGIALILGVLTRLVALALAIDMLAALVIVHLPNGFFLPDGIEFVLALLTAFATLALTGAGAYSVDEAVAARRVRA